MLFCFLITKVYWHFLFYFILLRLRPRLFIFSASLLFARGCRVKSMIFSCRWLYLFMDCVTILPGYLWSVSPVVLSLSFTLNSSTRGCQRTVACFAGRHAKRFMWWLHNAFYDRRWCTLWRPPSSCEELTLPLTLSVLILLCVLKGKHDALTR